MTERDTKLIMESPPEETSLVTKIRVRQGTNNAFADWQAELNAVIAAFPGFISLEILSPSKQRGDHWLIIQRFVSPQDVVAWKASTARQSLTEKLKPFLSEGPEAVQEIQSGSFNQEGTVTEVFVTQVSSEKVAAFRDWIAKIHQVEAKFPGFRGVYVQSPNVGKGKNWITLLQFDTPENLNIWLASSERQQVLDESISFVDSLESHRVISPYAGWFASVSQGVEAPPLWKQTMIILLVLFPIVMFELKFLSPITSGLNSSLATFISNAISVSLISWPMMPIAVRFLGWWLSPKPYKRRQATVIGTLIVVGLYTIEIFAFWKLLP